MPDQPGAAVGYQGVAIAAEMVEPNMGDHGEVRRDLRLLRGQPGEQHIGEVVPDDGLDVDAIGDVAGDTAEERRDLGSPAQRLQTAYLEHAVRAERLRETVESAGVTRPVVPRQSVPDPLTGNKFPHLHRRRSSPGSLLG